MEREQPRRRDAVRDLVVESLRRRNQISRRFFDREADRLALACREMAERFRRGGRLLAFGRGPYTTDAQHVAVEFVHPVIVGKQALPALDLSIAFREWVPALVRPDDMAMGFAGPGGDSEVSATLAVAARRGAMTFALPGSADASFTASYAVEAGSDDPLIHQELIEILYHTLWETVHVYLEHRELGQDAGAASFLYPFLGTGKQDTRRLAAEVAASIRAKATEDERLREQVAGDAAGTIERAAETVRERVAAGGTLLLFGNGGSATDANDWALDCALATAGGSPIPAVSLAMEPASVSAIANDIGADAVFLRQLIAQARADDVAIAISTSGGSRNVVMALEEARKRGLATIALLGYDGGEVVRRALADHALVVSCDYIPRIQEVQASIYHVMLEALAALERAGSRAELAVAAAGSGETPASPSITSQGRAATNAAGVELFGSASCPFTTELREHLEWEGRAFVEHDVESDSGARRRLADLLAPTGRARSSNASTLRTGALRVPVLVVEGEVVEIGWRGRSCLVDAGAEGSDRA